MSIDMNIELCRVRGTLSEGGAFISISSDEVLNLLQFLFKILKVSLIVCFFKVYRVPYTIEVFNKINGNSHECTLYRILREQTVTLSGVGILKEVHLHLAFSDDGTVGQLEDGYQTAIDVNVPLSLLALINLATLVRDPLSGKHHSCLLNERAQQMSIESGVLGVSCGLGRLCLCHVERLHVLVLCHSFRESS